MSRKILKDIVKKYTKKVVVVNFNSVKKRFCLEVNGLTMGGNLRDTKREDVINFLLNV